jgi:hypothetical protein
VAAYVSNVLVDLCLSHFWEVDRIVECANGTNLKIILTNLSGTVQHHNACVTLFIFHFKQKRAKWHSVELDPIDRNVGDKD